MDRDRCVAIDTEFGNDKVPFIATSCDWQLRDQLYNCHKKQELEKLRAIAEDRSIIKIMFPMTVDWYTLKKIGIECRGDFEDPLVAGTLLDENFANRKGLKPMAQRYLKADIKEAKELSKYKRKYKKIAKEKGIEFDYSMIPKRILHPYAVEDAVFTQKLWFYFRDAIRKFDGIYQLEKKVAKVIVKMQETQMMVDRPFCFKQIAQYEKDVIACEQNIKALLKKHHIKMPEFKIGSSHQVGYVLTRMGVILPRTRTGKPCTEAKVLMEVQDHPMVKLIFLNRFLNKQLGTYFKPLVRRYTTRDHPFATFFLFGSGARTGRMSAELIQTIPRPDESRTAHAPKVARRAFRPRPGRVLVAADFKALQMLIFFHFAKATALIKKCNDGWDPHDAACEMLFGMVEKELRKDTKNIQFGIVFGMGKNKLMGVLKRSKAKKQVTSFEATRILQKYYANVPVREFSRQCISELYKTGVLKLAFDSDLMSFHREYQVPQEFAYKGPNVIIQGTEAYVVKCAMLRSMAMIKRTGMDMDLLMQVHDELLFEVSEKEPLHLVDKEIKKAMEDHVTLSTKLRVDTKWSKTSWGEVESWAKVKHLFPKRTLVTR